MRLCVSLFCLLISFAHHCYPDDGRGIRAAVEDDARKGDGESPRPLDLSPPPLSLPFSPRQLAVLYGTVHYFSTVYTAARSSLAYGLFAAVLFLETWDSKFNLSICPQDFLIKSDYFLKYLMLSLKFLFFSTSTY